ncbi:hypothetical protein IAT40_000004 [Kwoniella sp. CBS 6097]
MKLTQHAEDVSPGRLHVNIEPGLHLRNTATPDRRQVAIGVGVERYDTPFLDFLVSARPQNALAHEELICWVEVHGLTILRWGLQIRCRAADGGAGCEQCRSRKQVCSRTAEHGHQTEMSQNTASSLADVPISGIAAGSTTAGMNASPLSGTELINPYTSSWAPSVPSQAAYASSEDHAVRDLVIMYFASVHHFAYLSFIHETDFWELFERGRAPSGLTTLMAALALRFGYHRSDPTRLQLADQWASEISDTLIPRILDEFGAVELMEVVLCQTYNFLSGRYSRGMVMAGMAVRMMTFLRLNELDQWPRQANKPLIHRESLRRLAWSVWFLDATLDGGNIGASTIHDESFTIQLPLDERPFLLHQHVVTESLMPTRRALDDPISSSDSLDISAHLVRAMYARQALAQTQSRIQKRIILPAESGPCISAAEEKAEMLLRSMPTHLQYSRSLYHVYRDRRPTIVCLHMVRNNCQRHRSLLRMLYAQQTSSQIYDTRVERLSLIECAKNCSRILQDALEYTIPLDPQIGMHAYNAIEILLFQPGRLFIEHNVAIIPRQEVLMFLKPLIEVIRLLASICPLVALIYPEAINRMIQMGYVDELTNSDVMAVLQKVHCVDHAAEEFDWTESFWRYEMFLSRRARAAALAVVVNNAPPGEPSLIDQSTESPENALLEDALQEVPVIPANTHTPVTPLTQVLGDFAWNGSAPGLETSNQSTHEVVGLTELTESTEWAQPLPPGEIQSVEDPLSRLHDLFEIRTNQNSPSEPYRNPAFNFPETDQSDLMTPGAGHS